MTRILVNFSALFLLIYSTPAHSYDDSNEIRVCPGGYIDPNGECVLLPSNSRRDEPIEVRALDPSEIPRSGLVLGDDDNGGLVILDDGSVEAGTSSGGLGSRTSPGTQNRPNPNAGNAAPGGRSIASQVADLQAQFEQCEAKVKQTSNCCNNPMSCLTSDGSEGKNSGIYIALQSIAGATTQIAGVTGACGTLGTVSTGMAAINTALAFKCEQKISQCNAACGDIKKRAKELARSCQSNKSACVATSDLPSDEVPHDHGTNVDPTHAANDLRIAKERMAGQTIAALNQLARDSDQCDEFGGRAVEQTQQAIASTLAAKMAGLCKKQATASNPDNVATSAFNVNCSDPTNAANPVCQNQCNRANALNDPVCAQLLGQGTAGFGTGSSGSGTGLADPNAGGLGSGSIDEFEDAQAMLDANIAAQAAKANVSNGGGGGGVPSGASSSGGDSGGAGGGGDGGSGLNTGILTGVKSGSGYTQPFVRSNMGGGGYSAGAGGPARGLASTGKPFNPRDFLPGGKMDPKRKLAGLAASSPEIGAVHGNIFTNITNRFLQVCLRDGLFDCETLRKNSKPRN